MTDSVDPFHDISIFGEFKDPALEAQFRAANIAVELPRTRYFMLLPLLSVFAFIRQDYSFAPNSFTFYWLLGARCAFGLFTLYCFFTLKSMRDDHRIDRLISLWRLVGVALIPMIDSTRPLIYMSYVGSAIVQVVYFHHPFFPSLRRQLLPAALLSVWEIYLLLAWKQPLYPTATPSIISAVLLANVIAFSMAWFVHDSRREMYAAGLLAQSLRAQIQTLEDILPICSHCKNIRDEQGKWNRLENYLRDHKEMEFTHGICPDCTSKLFPDFAPGKT